MVNESIDAIEKQALERINQTDSAEELQKIKTKYLGRKGSITLFLRNIPSLAVEERPVAGKRANQVKLKLENEINDKLEQIENIKASAPSDIDISLPGRSLNRGGLHPISIIQKEICSIFFKLGFNVAEGPEIETDWYNFESLNIPKHHPARDMQDTFYVSDNVVLRTHTSPIQSRFMEKNAPPVRIIAPGKVYRCDSDLTHTPMFHQIEGLLVDKDISFGDLKGVLESFIHELFDEETSLRFRPSFFPFTEPSAEVDIRCVICKGTGCRVCSRTGWLEVLGSGMVHPAVFENVGYDTEKYSGFAFGMGIERLAMLKYGIDDLRKFFENDYRFLEQF
ncbi:MAG: phenylalanine--tRNA ligase subunit alpha [Deltaproteobacteria bacterium]|nr:MAG: phenylalanine--tRNA ligase subunit alpha [Deltaproteobacteria bacterium]